MVLVFKFGLMGQSMKVFGKMGKQMERESLYMLTEIFMMENGKMIKLADTDYTSITMELAMKAGGSTTISMDLVFKPGSMEVNTKEATKKERNTDKENMSGEIPAITKAVGKTIRLRALAFTFGLTEGSMWVIG